MAIVVTLGSALVFYVLATHGTFNPLYQQIQPGFADRFFRCPGPALVVATCMSGRISCPANASSTTAAATATSADTEPAAPANTSVPGPREPVADTAVYLTVALTLAVGSALAILSHLLAHVRRTPLVNYLGLALALSLGPAGALAVLGRPAVYEEAIAWSVAFALLGIYRICGGGGPSTGGRAVLVLSLVAQHQRTTQPRSPWE